MPMTFGWKYARNDYISRGIPRKYDPKSLKRTGWNNTMTYVDKDGHRWYRLCQQDIVKVDKSGKFAQIFWEDGYLGSLTPHRIGHILTSIWSKRRYGIHLYDLNHSKVQLNIDTGAQDYSADKGYRGTISLSYLAHSGMIIPKNGLPVLQGYKDPWKFKGKIDEWAKCIFKRGILTNGAKGKAGKWKNQLHCPECEKELSMFNKAWGIEEIDIDNPDSTRRLIFQNGEECGKVWDDLAYWKARPFGTLPDGELPFNHYLEESKQNDTFTHHLFRHIEAGEYPPALIAAAVRSSRTSDMVEYSNDPLFGRKFKFNTTNTGYLRWILRSYLVKRLGVPTWRI